MPENLELEELVGIGSSRESLQNERCSTSQWRGAAFLLCCVRGCPYLGIILAALSSVFFSLCSVIVKWLEDVHPMELAFFRFVGVLLPAIPIVIYQNESAFPKGKRLMLVMRSFTGTTGLMLSFYAFRHMPLADANVIVFSVPIFVTIFARIFLKEPCGWFNVVTVAATLLGVILITRPWVFDHILPPFSEDSQISSLWGAVSAFLATFFSASVFILLRALKGVHYSVIMTNFGAFGILQTLLVSYLLGELCLPKCGINRLIIVLLALFSFSGQILLTLSLKFEQAGPVSIARSADIVFAFIWQILFFDETPNMYTICGAFLVTTSVVLNGVRKWAIDLPDGSNIKKSLGILAK